MVDFSKYKNDRQKKTQQLIDAVGKPASGRQSDDTRFWKPTLDTEKGMGGAVIRFLPVQDDESLDFVKYSEYSFKWDATNRWFIERGLVSIGQEDPVYHLRSRLYATKQEVDKKLAEKMRLNAKYIANILVVNDPAHPENNGKVFLFRYGNAIQKYIETALKPVADAITGEIADVMDAFDVTEASNLEIRFQNTANGWNYKDTKWSSKVTPLAKTEEEIDAILAKTYSLAEFVSTDKFKTYAELEKRLVYVIGEPFIGSGVQVSLNGVVHQESVAERPKPEAIDEDDAPFEVSQSSKPQQHKGLEAKPESSMDADDAFEKLMAEM